MATKAQLQADLTDAMRARDELVVSTLRMCLAAITTAEVAGDQAVVLGEEQITDVLRAEAKKRAEAAELYDGAGREASAAKERNELAVIARYLPAAMSDEDLAVIAAEEAATAAAAGASGPKAMGVVVKAVRDRVGGAADGARIAAAVRAALA